MKIISIFFCFLAGGIVSFFSSFYNDYDFSKSEEKFSVNSVVVDDEVILFSDIDFEYNVFLSQIKFSDEGGFDSQPSRTGLWNEVVSSLIERKILYKSAKDKALFRKGLDPSCQQSEKEIYNQQNDKVKKLLDETSGGVLLLKRKLCEQATILTFLKSNIYSKLQITEQEIISEYEKDMDEFTRPSQVKAQHIFVGSERQALNIKDKVNQKNFSSLARKYSLAFEGESGGELPPYEKSQLPAVFDVGFSMRKGQISDILKSSYGFHLLWVKDFFPEVQLELSQVRAEIIDKLLIVKKEKAYSQWLNMCLQKSNIALL
jgi:parvulin-like peptidyl-prolyl isomerase